MRSRRANSNQFTLTDSQPPSCTSSAPCAFVFGDAQACSAFSTCCSPSHGAAHGLWHSLHCIWCLGKSYVVLSLLSWYCRAVGSTHLRCALTRSAILQGDRQVRPLLQVKNQNIQFVAGAIVYWLLVVPALLDHLTMLLHHFSKRQQVSQRTTKLRHAGDDRWQDHFMCMRTNQLEMLGCCLH